MGLNIHTILTCRKGNDGSKSFNVRQFNCIAWENAEDLRLQLFRRIEHVVGHGPIPYSGPSQISEV